MSRDDIRIEPVTEKDRPWIVEFLTRNFYRDEPITDYLKVCQNPFSLDELKKFSTKNLHQNLSFVAKDSAGNLLGVCINSVHTPDDEGEEITDPIFGKITKFLDYGYKKAEVFEKFSDIKKLLYMDIISVDKSVGGKGIGTLLVEHARMYSRVVRNVGVREKWVNLKHQIRKSSAFVPKGFEDTRSICFGSNRLSGYSLIGASKFSYIYQKHTRPMATYKGKLNYELITANEKEEVVEFLKKNFYADEPITRYLDVLGNPNSVKSLSQFSAKSLGQNISLLTRSETGELVGVCLNSIKAKDDPEDEPITDPVFGKIAKLLGFAYEESKVFEKFPDIDRVMSVDIISVDREFQGHGIAKILMDKTRDLAREKGIKMIRVDCTSYFSARASEKLGMECVYELKYADYKEDGVQVFNPEPPHTGLKVYVQRLD